MSRIVICPNVATCEWRCKAEEKKKHPRLYCPCEIPHHEIRFCTTNKCCSPCVPTVEPVR